MVGLLERVLEWAVRVDHGHLDPWRRKLVTLHPAALRTALVDARDRADVVGAPIIGKVVHDLLLRGLLHTRPYGFSQVEIENVEKV